MKKLRRMQILQTPQDLICNKPEMDSLQNSFANQGMQIGIHELEGKI